MIQWFDSGNATALPTAAFGPETGKLRQQRSLSQRSDLMQGIDEPVFQAGADAYRQSATAAAVAQAQDALHPEQESDTASLLRTRILRPLYAVAFLVVLFYAVFNGGQQHYVKASLWGALAVVQCGSLLYVHWTKEFPQFLALGSLCLGGLLVGVVYDVASYGLMESWVYLLVLVNTLVAMEMPRSAVLTTFLLTLAYLVVRSVEDVKRYGLYDSVPNENTYELPEAVGWSTGLTLLLSRLLLATLSFAIMWHYAVFTAVERHKLLSTVAFMQRFASALGHLDLDAAECALDCLPSPEAAEAFRRLNSRVRTYAQYIPETFLMEEEDSDGSADDPLPEYQVGSPQVQIVTTGIAELASPPGSVMPSAGTSQNVDMRSSVSQNPFRSSCVSGAGSEAFRSSGLSQNAFRVSGLSVSSQRRTTIDEGVRKASDVTAAPSHSENPQANPLQFSLYSEHRGGFHRSLNSHSEGERALKTSKCTVDEEQPRGGLGAASVDANGVSHSGNVKSVEGLGEIGVRQTRVTVMSCEIHLNMKKAESGFDVSTSFISTVMDAVRMEKGMTLEITADRVMSVWNGHVRCVRHCRHACRAALRASAWWRGNHHAFTWCGAAIASGEASVGNIGGERRRAAFVHGAPTLEEKALLSLGRAIRTRIVVTERVVEQTQAFMVFRPVEIVNTFTDTETDHNMPPLSPSSQVFETVSELCCDRSSGSAPEAYDEYSKAFTLFRTGLVEEAASRFARLTQNHPHDAQILRVARIVLRERDRAVAYKARKHSTEPAFANMPEYQRYSRKLVGWRALGEANITETIFDVGVYDTTDQESRNLCLSPARASITCNSEGRLREDLEQHRKAEISDGGTPTEAAGETTSTPPERVENGNSSTLTAEFVDRTGSRWRRSQQVLIRGGRSDLYQVLGEDGVLCIAKCVDVSDESDDVQQGRVDELLCEVGHLSRIQHENVVSYISSAVVPGHILTVMEYVSGGSLHSLVQNFGALPRTSCQRYMRDILKGLAFLHNRGIVHRDLKPANVLMDPDGMCKLADFGAAATLATQRGGAVGTPPYISPEACDGHVQSKSDIWSFGVSMCELLTKEVPFPLEDRPLAQFMFLHVMANEVHDPIVPSMLNAAETDMMLACLRRDQSARPTASDLLDHCYFTA